MKSLPRDVQKLANEQGWEEGELLALLADFVVQNSLEEDLMEFLREEAEKTGGNITDQDDRDTQGDD